VLQNHTHSNIHRIESIEDPAADVAQNREKGRSFVWFSNLHAFHQASKYTKTTAMQQQQHIFEAALN
jgi:hypothetical protein